MKVAKETILQSIDILLSSPEEPEKYVIYIPKSTANIETPCLYMEDDNVLLIDSLEQCLEEVEGIRQKFKKTTYLPAKIVLC